MLETVSCWMQAFIRNTLPDTAAEKLSVSLSETSVETLISPLPEWKQAASS